MTRRRRVHATDPAVVHALRRQDDQLDLTDRSQRFEQLQLAAPPPARVTHAIVGDVVTVDASVKGGVGVVRDHCETPAAAYYCLPCHQRLANAYQLQLHVADGTHVVARDCELHGLETLTGESL